MRIDFKKEIDKCKKRKKIALIMSVIFLVLGLVSIIFFIIFSNYKIQVLMTLLGAFISSIFVILSIGFLVISYLPNKYLLNLFNQLNSKDEITIRGLIKISNKRITLKKGLSFRLVYIKDEECYLIDEAMIQDAKEEQEYDVYLRDNYIVGLSHD